MKVFLSAVLISLLVCSFAYAHGGEKHGKGIEGVVEAVSSDHLTIKSGGKSYVIRVLTETKIKAVKDGNADLSIIKIGSRVHVEGSKLSPYEMAASEIHLEATSSESTTHLGEHK